MSSPVTYQPAFWKRLRKNRGAVFGLIIIAVAMLLAVFAYFIAPDHSTYANRIIPQISNKKPGFGILLLRVKKQDSIPPAGFFSELISGAPDAYTYVPLTAYRIQKDTLLGSRFIDDGITAPGSYPLTALASNPVIPAKFWLGSDRFGRDILSRLIIGVRVSLGVGLIAVAISLTIGILLGMLAGYYRGWVDEITMWLINVIWSIPTLLLVFAITLVLGKGFWQVFIAVGLTMWVNVARLVRGQVLAIRELEYIEAARALGFSPVRIMIRHMLPNILGPVMVIAASNFASAIVIEAGLSFLGVGVQPPEPSWGLMIRENYNFIITHNPMLALAPGIAIMLLVLAFNLLGNGLRDALDVKGKI